MVDSFTSRLLSVIASLSSAVSAASYKLDGERDVRLRFNNNNKFKIVQMTDLQFGEID